MSYGCCGLSEKQTRSDQTLWTQLSCQIQYGAMWQGCFGYSEVDFKLKYRVCCVKSGSHKRMEYILATDELWVLWIK